jgi:hypothetical protein
MKRTKLFFMSLGGIACFAFLAAGSWSVRQQRGPATISAPGPGIAYVAVRSNRGGIPVTMYYDRGRYSAFGANSFDVYDGTDTYLRWIGDTREQTAQLDAPLAYKRLFELIQHDGADLAAKKSGIDRSVLVRFARIYTVGPPRVLSHPLPIVSPGELAFERQFQKLPGEKVAGRTCDVYLARDGSGNKIWVDLTTHCMLRQHRIDSTDNPRIPPSVWDWEVSRFTLLPSVDPKHFQLPPGVTVTLPRILSDLPLPPGVHRKMLEGKNSYTGGNVEWLVENMERRLSTRQSLR